MLTIITFTLLPFLSGAIFLFLLFKLENSKFKVSGVAPSYISSLALTFGLFASLTATDVWRRIDQENNYLVAEANSLRTIRRFADIFAENPEIKNELRGHLTNYINNEQRLLTATRNTGEIYTASSQPLTEMFNLVAENKITANARINEKILDELITLRKSRFQRLETAKSHLNIFKLIGIVIFGMLTQIAIGLGHAGNFRAQVASVLLFSAAFSAIMGLLTIFENNSVFSYLIIFTPFFDVMM